MRRKIFACVCVYIYVCGCGCVCMWVGGVNNLPSNLEKSFTREQLLSCRPGTVYARRIPSSRKPTNLAVDILDSCKLNAHLTVKTGSTKFTVHSASIEERFECASLPEFVARKLAPLEVRGAYAAKPVQRDDEKALWKAAGICLVSSNVFCDKLASLGSN